MINTVIFDLDGTLINSLDDIRDCVNHTLTTYGYKERTLEEICSFIGDGAEMLMRRSLPTDISETDFASAFAYYREYYKTHSLIKTAPYEGIKELLAKLKSMNMNIAVNTNKPQAASDVIVKSFFGDLLVAGTVEERRRKPYPDGVEYIIKKLNVKKENCIYIGDTSVDINTGKNSGVKVIGVLWGFRTYDEIKEADFIASKPDDIADIVYKLNGISNN